MAVTNILAASDNAGNSLIGVQADRQPWAAALIPGDDKTTLKREWLKVRHTRPTGSQPDEEYDARQWTAVIPKGEARPVQIGGIDEAIHGCKSFFLVVRTDGVKLISRKAAENMVIGEQQYTKVAVADMSDSTDDDLPF